VKPVVGNVASPIRKWAGHSSHIQCI
jgi:hypothetical protein